MCLTYLTVFIALLTKEDCESFATLDIEFPFSPKSKTSIDPFSVSKYKICRLSSMDICTIPSSSLNAALRNDGTRKDKELVE